MFLQILAVASLGLMVNAQIDTTGCAEFSTKVTACATDNPIVAVGSNPVPPAISDTTALTFWMATPLADYCGADNKVNFGKQVGCLIEVIRACGDNQFKTLLASGAKYTAAVGALCASEATFTASCGDGLAACATDKFMPPNPTPPSKAAGFPANKEYYCNYTNFLADCVDTNAALSNCTTGTDTKTTFKSIGTSLIAEACVPPSSGGGGSGDDDDDDDSGAAEILVTSGLMIFSIFISLFI